MLLQMPRKILLSLLCFISLVVTSGAHAYSGGDGTPATPWQIASPADLSALMATSADWTDNFVVTADINASGIGAPAPIGNATTKFTGTFNGDGHAISNLTITRGTNNIAANNHIGLFGYNTGTISNLNVTSGSVSASNFVAILCGLNEGGTITNCSTSGTAVAAQDFCGGLCGVCDGGSISDSHSSANTTAGDYVINQYGYSGGFCSWIKGGATVDNCYATGTANAMGNAGGFCGKNDAATITNSYATGNATVVKHNAGGFCGVCNNAAQITSCHATGTAHADGTGSNPGGFSGGFCGYLEGSTVTECYATGNATSDNDYAGGFCGWNLNGGKIYRCFALGNATATQVCAGGFCGGNIDGTSEIVDCYARGNARADGGYAGGFCGWNNKTLTRCYSIGRPAGPSNIGGFCGAESAGTYTACFWDINRSKNWNGFGNATISAEVMGKTNVEMFSQSTYTSAGWNFAATWEMYDYPVHQWYTPTWTRLQIVVPTLGEWGVIILGSLLILTGLRRRKAFGRA